LCEYSNYQILILSKITLHAEKPFSDLQQGLPAAMNLKNTDTGGSESGLTYSMLTLPSDGELLDLS
jgi:hypothetical protein